MSDVLNEVPTTLDSMFVKPKASKISSQPECGVFSVKSGPQLGSKGAIPKTQQPPPKKSRGSGRNQFSGALAVHVVQLEVDEANSDNCSICTFELKDGGMYDDEEDDSGHGWAQLKDCKHTFHETCLREMMKKSDNYIQCPQCKKIYGCKVGTQPTTATMSHFVINRSLPGERCDTIEIRYSVIPGIQGPEHPNPGQQYHCKGFPRVAYLPNDAKGQKVLRLLKRAFAQRLIFTIGTSTTSGLDNVVTWNDIHHKTQLHPGEHGYPDPKYLDSVISDLAQHGITEP